MPNLTISTSPRRRFMISGGARCATPPRTRCRFEGLVVLTHIDGICLDGFSDPISLNDLHRSRCSGVPSTAGIYLITRTSDCSPNFLSKSPGGWFKRKDPSYSPEVVQANWIHGASVVYVGKGAGREGLKGRLCQLLDFGFGKPVGHRGGRLLWHLKDSGALLVRWRTCGAAEADGAETEAIAGFKAAYGGRRPYANMNK
jgi:hypothetical protein